MRSFRQGLFVAVYALLTGLVCAAGTPSKVPLTDAECEAAAREIEDQWDNGDHKALGRFCNFDAMLERAVAGVTLPDQFMTDLRAGFLKGYADNFEKGMSAVEEYHFLRLRKDGNETKALFRLTGTKFGVAYHELYLYRAPNGKLRASDMYIYMAGERMSDIFRRMLMPLLMDKQKSAFEKLFTDKSEFVKTSPVWLKVPTLVLDGKYKEAMQLYKTLPPEVQKEKFLLLARLRAAQELGLDEYLAAIDLLRKTYPKDPSVDLISIGAFTVREQYAEALAAIERLDQSLGGDPFQQVERATIHLAMTNHVKAQAALKLAISQEPTLLTAYDYLLTSYSATRQFGLATNTLGEVVRVAGVSRRELCESIESDKDYSELVASPEYQQWRGHAMRATTGTSGNPKGPVPPAAGKAELPKPAATALKLNGIFYKASGASATINGKFVMVGDRILEHKVVAIEKDSVTLEAADGNKVTLKVD